MLFRSPARSAWDLHQAWPEARFQFVQDAGHAASEPGTKAALVRAAQNVTVFQS